MKELPEKLAANLVAEGTSESTGAKRQIWKNAEFGITLVVTWAPPRMNMGVQQFTCADLPLYQFNNYEALRKVWAEKVGVNK